MRHVSVGWFRLSTNQNSLIYNHVSAKTMHSSHAAPPLQYDKGQYSYRVHCPWPDNKIALVKLFTTPQILSMMTIEKLGTDVHLTNSLTPWPQRHCDKKASIETAREQSVIVMSQLLPDGSCFADVTISQQLFWYFEIVGDGNGINVDLRQLNDRKHIFDRCTECTEIHINVLEMFCRCNERRTRHLDFRGDSGFFRNYYIDKNGKSVNFEFERHEIRVWDEYGMEYSL